MHGTEIDMHTENNSPLSCEKAIALLDEGIQGAENAALEEHLAACGECRAMARILQISASLAADVPADMTGSVMTRIRRERLKQSARMRFVRRFGAVAAAAVLVPAAVIFAPILFGAKDAASVPAEGVTAAVADTAEETMAFTCAETVVEAPAETEAASRGPVMMMAPPPAVTSEVSHTEDAANGASDAVPPAGPAPSYVTSFSAQKQSDSAYATMAVDEMKQSRPLRAVFTVLLGAEKAALMEENDLAAAALLCRENKITREEFLAAAEALHVEITEEQIKAIFG